MLPLLITLIACILRFFTGWAWPTDRNRFSTALTRLVGKLDSAAPEQGPARAAGRRWPSGSDA